MFKRKINWKKLLGPTDSVAVVVVLVGLLIAIFLDELAIRLIGVCVALLGGVALAMLISQRMAEIVDDKYKPSQPPPNYKITVKKETGARRQTFEDFEKHTVEVDAETGDDENNKTAADDIKIISKTFDKPKKKEYETDKGESFKIIDRRASSQPDLPVSKDPVIAPEVPVNLDVDDDFEFDDGISSVRIVAKTKTQSPEISTTYEENDDKAIVKDIPESKESYTQTKVIDASYGEGSLFEDVKTDEDNIEISPADADEKSIDTDTTKSSVDEKIPDTKLADKEVEVPKMDVKFQKKDLNLPLSSIIETETFSGQEPRKEFEYFLNRVLKIIRSITNTRTAAFLLVNLEKRELILQAFESESPEAITPKMKLPIRDDIVSQIAINIKPEILTEINPAVELDLIPYYTRKVGTGSFVGVPVFYKKAVIGILCADSSAPDAYEAFTVGFLGHFTKLIGSLVSAYTEKYELQQASKTLNAINEFRKIMSEKNADLDSIYISILDAACKIFDYTTIGICGYNQENESWKITAIISKNEIDNSLAGHEIKLKSTYVGDSIEKSKTIFISPMLDVGMMYHPKETKYPGGFFTSVPLKSATNSYGALFIVGKSQSNVTSYDLKILETICDNAGSMLEHYLFMNMLKNNSMVETGGLLNEAAFISRLEEEMTKSRDVGNRLALCLFSIDKISAIDPARFPERAEKVFRHVTDIFKKYLKSYYPLGKISNEIYGIVLTELNGPDAHRWAEKIRSDIARTPIEIEQKRYYVTVSIGIAETAKGDTIKNLADNATIALNISIDKSNKVTLFE